jgi:glycosyltransferase involved in cell wall biosynthesis
MRVAFDTSVTETDPGGISRYVNDLLGALERDDHGVELMRVSMLEEWPWTKRLERHLKVLVHDQLWVTRGMVSTGRRLQADVIHGSAFKVAAVAEPAASVTIHDDTPWASPPTASLYNRLNLRRTLERAAPVVRGALVSTDTTASAILRHLPALEGRTYVTPFGINHAAFRPVPDHLVEQARARYAILGRPYALMVGPYGPRKNYPRMIEALSRLRSQPQGLSVVVTGRAAGLGRSPLPVIETGFIGDDDLAALYTGAEFLFYASLSEGFGFPVLEAMACGCAVLTTRGMVLEELAGDAALLVDPTDLDAMTAACETMITDKGLRQELAAAGIQRAGLFDWDQTAAATAQAWRSMI